MAKLQTRRSSSILVSIQQAHPSHPAAGFQRRPLCSRPLPTAPLIYKRSCCLLLLKTGYPARPLSVHDSSGFN